jgi:predicted transcriptional regulator
MATATKTPQKKAKASGIDTARAQKLNLNNLAVLKALKGGPLPAYKIAAALSVTKQNLAYNTQKLLDRELITKNHDLEYLLTDEGKKIAATLQ